MYQTSDTYKLTRRIVILTCLMVLMFLFYDFLWYGIWTFSFWNFLKINIFANVSSIFGVQPFGWYALIGLPTMALLAFPLGLVGLYSKRSHKFIRSLIFIFVITWMVMETIPHKETRFLHSQLPLLLIGSSFITAQNWKIRTAVLITSAFSGIPDVVYFKTDRIDANNKLRQLYCLGLISYENDLCK